MGKDTVELFDVIPREDQEDGDSEEVDIVLRVHVQPGAGRTEMVGRYGDALKVKVAAPPEAARANEEVAQLLAATLGVAPSHIALVAGEASPSKRFRIGPVEVDVVRRLLASRLEAETGPKAGGGGRGGNARGGGGVR